jgi:subtilisin family serine protease
MRFQWPLVSRFLKSRVQRTLPVFLVFFLMAGPGYAKPSAKNLTIITLGHGASVSEALKACNARILKELTPGETFLIQAVDQASASELVDRCSKAPGVESAERDQLLSIPSRLRTRTGVLNESTVALLNESTVALLNDATMTNYFGTIVKASYPSQPALALMGNDQAHTLSTGTGMVIADIDNGIDPGNPVLRGVLVSGYNFVDENQDVSEWTGLDESTVALLNQNQSMGLDQSTVSLLNESTVSLLNESTVSLLNESTVSLLNESTVALLNESTVALLNESTVALLNESTVALLNESTVALLNQLPPDFGHGTMVAGLIHVVAPDARIQPLKAFGSDGTGTLSDVVSAILYATDHGANVINMSFSFSEDSKALKKAINYALDRQVILVSSMGNDGQETANVFPSAYPGVYGIAATDNQDIVAPFSNYGSVVDYSAPGVNLITFFPGGHYAMVSGTSFSCALTSGVAALSVSAKGLIPSLISSDFSLAAVPIDSLNPGFEKKLGRGRVDEAQTLQNMQPK